MNAKISERHTKRILKGMLTENTGRHPLDSGGIYGRAFEARQGRDFDAEPQSTVRWDDLGYLEISHSLYHFLASRLSYNAKMTRKFKRFANTKSQKDLTWGENIENFIEKYGTGEWSENTANTDSHLDGTIQYHVFSDEDDNQYVILQVHGGCDIRGGYTEPKIFDLTYPFGYGLDGEQAIIFCPKHGDLWRVDQCETEGTEINPDDPKQQYLFGDADSFAKQIPSLKGMDETETKLWLNPDEKGNCYCRFCGSKLESRFNDI